MTWWKRYWFGPEALLNLVMCRVVIVGYHLSYAFGAYNPIWSGRVAQYASLPSEFYDPLPVLHAMIWPVGWTYRPGLEVLEVAVWLSVAAGILALVGLATNVSLLCFAAGSIFLQAYFYSFGDFHHASAPVLIALGVLALGPSGRVLSLDSFLRRRRKGERRKRIEEIESSYARWPLLLIGWVLGLVYFSAAISKVNLASGLDWLNGFTLQWNLLRDGLRWEWPLGLWLAQHHQLAVLLSWVTVVFEGTFFLAVAFRFRALSLLYVAVGAALHVGMYLTMRTPFFGFIALYSVLIPWHRLWAGVRARLASRRVWSSHSSGERQSWAGPVG